MKNEIILLQKEMKKEGIAVYVVPSADFHDSEYVSDYFKCREFLTGFTGSAGTLVVTIDEAFLWTDGRYFLQAEEQLKGTEIQLMKMGEEGVPTLSEKITELLLETPSVGFDGRCVSFGFIEGILNEVEYEFGDVKVSCDEDLVDRIWKDRPGLPCGPVTDYPLLYAGEERAAKLKRVREAMGDAEALVLSDLSDIAWLFNLRGEDIPCNPVFLAYAVVERDSAVIFLDEEKMSEELECELEKDDIFIAGYEDIYAYLEEMGEGEFVSIDRSHSNFLLCDILANCEIIDEPSPVQLMKAVKNETEMNHLRNAHIKDGVAVTKFIYWLKNNIGKREITELDCSEKFEELRGQQELYMGPSFDSICAYGAHAAIIHYEPTEESNIKMEPRGLALFDTGGQYLDGTTDITRTVVLGELTDDERKYFTLVLKGNLKLGGAKFKKGCTGSCFDYLAREALWQQGEDYNHGTGHGVGFYLNVHEAPNGFRYREKNGCTFETGMLTSNEPGYYAAGRFGIRHENLVLCVPAEKTDAGEFLEFETVTLVPFDLDGIDLSLLDGAEKKRLNEYHKRVFETIGERLEEPEREWLRHATREV